MKKIVIIAIIILGIVSCKSNGDEPTPSTSTSSNTYMRTLNNTTWLLVDKGNKKGSYLSPTYIDFSINKSTISYKDSTLTFRLSGNTVSWTATYYLDGNDWLWYYYNPKKQFSVFEEFGLQYNISGNTMYQTNAVGEWTKYIKQ